MDTTRPETCTLSDNILNEMRWALMETGAQLTEVHDMGYTRIAYKGTPDQWDLVAARLSASRDIARGSTRAALTRALKRMPSAWRDYQWELARQHRRATRAARRA